MADTGGLLPAASLTVVVLRVAWSMGSLKPAETVVVVLTPVAPSAGNDDVTVGGVVSGGGGAIVNVSAFETAPSGFAAVTTCAAPGDAVLGGRDPRSELRRVHERRGPVGAVPAHDRASHEIASGRG